MNPDSPLPTPPPRVLLGTVGTAATWGILASIRERWGNRVHVSGMDAAPSRVVTASAIVDHYARVPRFDEPGPFGEAVVALIGEQRIDTYVPTFDSEIVLAAKLRDQGSLSDIRVLAPSLWAAETCWDKRQTSSWLSEQGFTVPVQIAFEPDQWRAGGLFVKPSHGIGSVGAQRVDDRETWLQWCRRQAGDRYLAEELLPGPEVTLDCFRAARSGTARVVCRERVEVKAGVCTKARVFDDPELARLGSDIGRAMELTGTYCIQVMRTGDERGWAVTDLNARSGAGTRLSAAVGVQLHAAMLADAWGLDVDGLLPPIERERWVARYYQEVVLA